MKKLLVLLFSILISFNSYGEWTKYGDSIEGNSMYIDYSGIKEHNGFVYFWEMVDYLTPSKHGTMSTQVYIQTKCETYRSKYLTYVFYTLSMGDGDGNSHTPTDSEWWYPGPESVIKGVIESVCDYVK